MSLNYFPSMSLYRRLLCLTTPCRVGPTNVFVLISVQFVDVFCQQDGFTPMYVAAQENHIDVVRYLLVIGADQTLAAKVPSSQPLGHV